MKKVLLILCFLLPISSFAATLSGSLVFTKKPPFTGVLFANGGKGPESAKLDQKNKVFDSNLLVVGTGGNITFKNSDDFQHNVFANDPKTNVKFDVGLMEKGQSTDLPVGWEENTITRIGCKIHPKMRSYIANINSDTFHVFPFEKKIKEYAIELDADSHESFTLSIPKYDELIFTLKSGESKTLEVTRKGKKRASLTVTLK